MVGRIAGCGEKKQGELTLVLTLVPMSVNIFTESKLPCGGR